MHVQLFLITNMFSKPKRGIIKIKRDKDDWQWNKSIILEINMYITCVINQLISSNIIT